MTAKKVWQILLRAAEAGAFVDVVEATEKRLAESDGGGCFCPDCVTSYRDATFADVVEAASALVGQHVDVFVARDLARVVQERRDGFGGDGEAS